MHEKKTNINVFIAYAREDAHYLDNLRLYLKPLHRNETIKIWYDGEIVPGTFWEKDIKDNLHKADIILLLVSAYSLASDYFYDKEMADALGRHNREETIVIPVILTACMWEETELKNLQALPRDGEPLKSWADESSAYTNVVRGLKKSVGEVKKRRDNLAKEKVQAETRKQEEEERKLKEKADQEIKIKEEALAKRKAEEQKRLKEEELKLKEEADKQKKTEEEALAKKNEEEQKRLKEEALKLKEQADEAKKLKEAAKAKKLKLKQQRERRKANQEAKKQEEERKLKEKADAVVKTPPKVNSQNKWQAKLVNFNYDGEWIKLEVTLNKTKYNIEVHRNTGLKKVFSGRFTLKVNGLKYDSSQSEGDYFHSYFILSNRNFSVGTGDLLSNLKSYRFELYFDFNSKFAASKFRPGKFNSPLVLRVSTTPFSFMNFKEIKYETILESDLERSWEK